MPVNTSWQLPPSYYRYKTCSCPKVLLVVADRPSPARSENPPISTQASTYNAAPSIHHYS
jgi:hypothetical protein